MIKQELAPSLMEFFTIQDIKSLKQSSWWTACQMTPFLIKGALVSDCYLLIVTNLRQTWVCKGDQQQIIREKQLYNNSIETSSFAGICEILDQVVSKYNENSQYIFEIDEAKQNLMFEFQSIIKIYPLKWKFNLTQINQQQHYDILCEDLLNPLICTVRCLENKCRNLEDQLVQSERELIKRMNERERSVYKGKQTNDVLIEGGPHENLIGNFKIANIEFGNQASQYMNYYSMQKLILLEREHKKKKPPIQSQAPQPQKQPPLSSQQASLNKKQAIAEAYEQSLRELFGPKDKVITLDEVEQQRLQIEAKSKNKPKKKDFL